MKMKIKAVEITADGSAAELAELISNSAAMVFGGGLPSETTTVESQGTNPIGFIVPPEPNNGRPTKAPRKKGRKKVVKKPRKTTAAKAKKTTPNDAGDFVPPAAGSKRSVEDIDRMSLEAIRAGATKIGQVAVAIEASWPVASRSVSRLVSSGRVTDGEDGLRVAAGQ